MRRFAVPAVLWRAISRMASTDSCLAESMKEQVFTTRISASSTWLVNCAPARSSRPIITSESTRFLGQPNEIKPTVGVALGGASSVADADSLLTYLLYRDMNFFARARAEHPSLAICYFAASYGLIRSHLYAYGDEEAFGVGGVLALRVKLNVLSVGVSASSRQDCLAGLVYGSFRGEGHSFEVIGRGYVGVGGDGFFSGSELGVGVAGLEKEDGFVAEVESGLDGIGLSGGVKGCFSLGSAIGTNVDFSQAAVDDAGDIWSPGLNGCDRGSCGGVAGGVSGRWVVQRLEPIILLRFGGLGIDPKRGLEAGFSFRVLLQAELREAEFYPREDQLRLGCGVLEHDGFGVCVSLLSGCGARSKDLGVCLGDHFLVAVSYLRFGFVSRSTGGGSWHGRLIVLVVLGDELVAHGLVSGIGVAVGDEFGDGEAADGDDHVLAADGHGCVVGADVFIVDEVGGLEFSFGDEADNSSGIGIYKELAVIAAVGFEVLPVDGVLHIATGSVGAAGASGRSAGAGGGRAVMRCSYSIGVREAAVVDGEVSLFLVDGEAVDGYLFAADGFPA